jgi:hypothetical protein
MSTAQAIEGAAAAVARGTVRDTASRAEERIDGATDSFRQEAAARMEALAEQIRELGGRFDRHTEAHHLARRIERSSDYLRYRPTSRIASDAWDTVRRSPVLWVGSGVLAGMLLYRSLARR